MTDNDIWNNDLERTRSLYHTEESSRRNSLTEQSDINQTLNTVNDTGNEEPKKRSKTGLFIGIGAAALVLIGVLFIFVGRSNTENTSTAIARSPGTIRKSMGRIVKGEENKTKADMASQIRDDDNIFIIDPSLYDGLCIDHTTTFLTEEGDVEASGIYLGSTENGKPEGYGAFYHRREGKEESIEYVMDIILFGDWHEGNLIKGQDITRKTLYVSENKSAILNIKYIIEGKWGNKEGMGFSDNPNGIYIKEVTDKGSKEVLNGRSGKFVGVFEENSITPMSGEEYTLDGTLVYNGEYKDGEYYNGTIYDENGNVKSVVKDGVIYDE